MNAKIPSSVVTVMLLSVALVAASLVWSPVARADACDWEGAEDNVWTNAANWSCGRVPGANDDVTISGEVEISVPTTIGSLVVKTFGDISSPSPSQVITVNGDFTWTGGYIGTGVTVRGQTTVEGEEDKIIRGRGRLTTSNQAEGLRVSGTGVLLIDTDDRVVGLTSPSTLLEDGAQVRSSGCCSTIRSWDVTDLRVAGDAHVVDLKVLLGFASVAQGGTLSIAGGLLDIKELPTGSSRAFGDVGGFQGGQMVVGAPVPGGSASEATDVTLPALMRLGDLTWEHRGGSIYSRTKAVVDGPMSGKQGVFMWTGGSLAGDLTVNVLIAITGREGGPISIEGPNESRSGRLTLRYGGSIIDGAHIQMSGGTSIHVPAGVRVVQDPGTRIHGVSLPAPLLSVQGRWAAREGLQPSVIDGARLEATSVEVGSGSLTLTGEIAHSIGTLAVTVGSRRSGLVDAGEGSLKVDRLEVGLSPKGFVPTPGWRTIVAGAKALTIPRTGLSWPVNANTTLLGSVRNGQLTLESTRLTDTTLTGRCLKCPDPAGAFRHGWSFTAQMVVTRTGNSRFSPGSGMKLKVLPSQTAGIVDVIPFNGVACTPKRSGAIVFYECAIPDNVRSATVNVRVRIKMEGPKPHAGSAIGQLSASEPFKNPDDAIASVRYVIRP